MKPGTVLFNSIHQIADKGHVRKLLIILSDGKQYPFISVTTTSRPNPARGIQLGCQIKDRFPNFFLPLHSTYLKEDTWIQLDHFMDLNPFELTHCYNVGKFEKVCVLPRKIFKDLLICTISSMDISDDQEKELWKTLVNIDIYYQEKS